LIARDHFLKAPTRGLNPLALASLEGLTSCSLTS
jgi:hypothetical protein